MTENEAKAKGVKYGRGVVPVGGERAFLAARSTRA
jgi:hypothetical protein